MNVTSRGLTRNADPKHEDLSRKHGIKIFQSYLQDNTPGADRLYWAYGPDKSDITILANEPYTEDKKRGAFERIKLSKFVTPKGGKDGTR